MENNENKIYNINDLPENIKSKLEVVGKHWIWRGAIIDKNRKDPKGCVRYNGKTEHVHRLVFHLLAGFDLNSGLQANHEMSCMVSLCCHPNCLYEGTQKDNVRDSIQSGNNKELNKTCCPNCKGPYSTSPTTGHRYCQACKNARRDKWRKSKNA